ncbi:putative membrane protein [Gemmobacter caeni]|uniref:Putative membrane protein n=1 Tax=Gemmobacter caeni TaxID=589035 RepID=A0A2T6B375_9RHOB|nr:peptide-binding protein [Gemmobacter caeni]PTX50537.1 putative membrane protein [Gemmobacter caeni]TWI98246.1 putative membrane protein [Gemmobacter caeni]
MTSRFAALIACSCLTTPALAQDMPALFDVRDVAPDDVLNIRTLPEANAPQIGSLPHDARMVEVVALAPGGTWGRVSLGEASGWVSMRYLAPVAGPGWQSLDRPMTCFGTEPFWSLVYDPARRNMALSQMGDQDGALGLWIDWHLSSTSRAGQIGWQIEGPARKGFATLTAESCNDGMSDRDYGLSISLFVNPDQESGAEPIALSGCCSLAP